MDESEWNIGEITMGKWKYSERNLLQPWHDPGNELSTAEENQR
jgi:hypothetical protein